MKNHRSSTNIILLMSLAIIASGCSNFSTPKLPTVYHFEEFVTIKDAIPIYVVHAGDNSGRLFVALKSGEIRIIENGELIQTRFLDIRHQVNSDGKEIGFLGIAFHPNFAHNGNVYVSYIGKDGASIISRWTVSDNPNRLNHGSEKIILRIEQPTIYHNSGHIEFGPDGYLYITIGDGGPQDDPAGNAQSTSNLLGTILRVDVDHGNPYSLPPDNPELNLSGKTEIYAYGLRNPWRIHLSAESNLAFVPDTGNRRREEINVLPLKELAGANFGWNYYEGELEFASSDGVSQDFVFPVHTYSRMRSESNPVCAIVGGQQYYGRSFPEWHGVYFFADFCAGEVSAMIPTNNGEWIATNLFEIPHFINSFGADEFGELYIVGNNAELGYVYLFSDK